jgi:MurNAc alpha-1-phosphate uridylyltransferase
MRALILAAGRGERMRPLTDTAPKPLLPVRGKPLIEWHLQALARGGVRDVVINTAWLEEQFPATLGDGSRWGLRIRYSTEGRDHGGALETAGGIAKALRWLGEVFWLVSGDVFVPGFVFDPARADAFDRSDLLAHLWLVPNPGFHEKGDFGIGADGYGLADAPGADGKRWTYANLALCRASLVAGIAPGTKAALGPLLYAAMRQRHITVEPYLGEWHNVGTPAQLAALQSPLR